MEPKQIKNIKNQYFLKDCITSIVVSIIRPPQSQWHAPPYTPLNVSRKYDNP